MKRLLNKKVSNVVLGEGIITKVENTDKGIFIHVKFPSEIKRYGFPIAIGKALASDDEELNRFAEEVKTALEEARKKAEEEARQKAEEEAQRKAEEKALGKEVILSEEEYESLRSKGDDVISSTDRNPEFEPLKPGSCRIFKVHQGKTFLEEFTGGYVWAPASGIHHHEKMTAIHRGDIIFHYANGNLVAVGEALSDCFIYPRPKALAGNGWGRRGYRVEVRYEKLSVPYSLLPHSTDIESGRARQYSSFDSNGDACQGYMYELEYVLAKIFKNGILSKPQPIGVKKVLGRIL